METDQPGANAPSGPEIMTVDEVAAFLRVNRNTVYEAAHRQRIPHQRIGRRIIFSRQALLAWLTGGVRESRR
jgi:excisionase family DNA binding protein